MHKVKLVGPGLKIHNVWHWGGDMLVVNEVDYEKNKKFLEIIEETAQTSNENIIDTIEENNEQGKIIKDEQGNEQDNEQDEEKLIILKDKARKLGIKFNNRTKKEILLQKISEIENKGDCNVSKT